MDDDTEATCANTKFIWQYFEKIFLLRMPKSWRSPSLFIYKCIAMSEAGKETRQGMNGQWWKCALWQVHNVARTHISELCGTFRHKWSSQAFLYPLFIFLRNFLFIFIGQIHRDYLLVSDKGRQRKAKSWNCHEGVKPKTRLFDYFLRKPELPLSYYI